MIKVKLLVNADRIIGVRASGHSNLDKSGNDILCAAVSTLIQTAYLAIVDIYGDIPYKERDGYFEFNVPDGHDADVIIRAMQVGLQDLASGFPQNLNLEEA